jgi:hypothetical protein
MHDADVFDQWEILAEDDGSIAFDSIELAFRPIEKVFAESERAIERISQSYDAYWWCGCFHSVSPSLTFLSRPMLSPLARSTLGLLSTRAIRLMSERLGRTSPQRKLVWRPAGC